MKYVIIGNSAAAVATVEGIRQVDSQNEIWMISDEHYHTYSRPLISYLLQNKTTEQKMKYREERFYKENGVKLLLSKRVTKIQPQDHEITLESGESISYDKLLVATGSRPFVPPIAGLEQVCKRHTFSCLDDAKAIAQDANEATRVLIVGAGLIGLKCAEGLENRVASITVVDLADRLLSSILDKEGSALLQKHLENEKLQFKLKNSVTAFEKNKAMLADGSEIEFDMLVMAVGVRANTELVKNAGGAVNRGILVNSQCETTLPDIYAAGDCTEYMDISAGENRIMAILPNAYLQGECAGKNMAGAQAHFDKAIPMNAIGFRGMHILTAGSYTGEIYEERDRESYKKLFYSDNHLNGFILIGEIRRAGIYTALIRERTPLDLVDFELICKNPCLMAFSREERKKQLGGGLE